MSKRSFLFALAAGLLANEVFLTSSEAGSITVVTETALLNVVPSNVSSVTELSVTFSGLSPSTIVVPGSLTLSSPSPTKGNTISWSGSTVDVFISTGTSSAWIDYVGTFSATFSFEVNYAKSTAETKVKATSTSWVTNKGNKTGTSSVAYSAVPEPSSMSLFGIGMASFFAFRRFRQFRNT